MAKNNASSDKKKEEIRNVAKGKCSECERTDQLRAVISYTSTGKRRILRKCPAHFQSA